MNNNLLTKIFFGFFKFESLIIKFADILPIGILIHSHGVIKYVNKKGLELLKADSPERLINKPVMSIVHKDSVAEAQKRIEYMRQTKKKAPPLIEKMLSVNGEEIIVEVEAMPISFFGKEAFLVMARDLTDLHSLNMSLIKNQNEKKIVLDSIDEAIIETDSLGKILEIKNNPPNLQGIIKHFQKYHNVWEAINPDESDKLASLILGTDKDRVVKVKLNSDPKIICEVKVKKIDQNRTFLFLSDITHSYNLEKQLLNLVQENKAKNQELQNQNEELKKTRTALISLIEDLENEIKEKNKYQETLRKSELKYREIFDNLNEAIFIDDADTGRMIDVNKTMLKMYGYDSKEEVLMGNIGDLSANIYPYDQENAEKKIRKAITEGPQKFEWLAKKKNGELFWVEVTLIYSKIAGENRVIAVAKDITDWKNIIKSLKESQELFEKVANTSAASIFVYQGTKFVYLNDEVERLTEYSKDELKEKNFWDIVHPKFVELIKMRGLARQKGERVESRYEFPIVSKSGKIKWLDFSADLITWKGKPAGIGIAIDITDKKRNELILKIQTKISHAVLTARNLRQLFYECRKEMSELVDTTNFYVAFYDKNSKEFYSPYTEDQYDDIERWPAEGSVSYLAVKRARPILITENEIKKMAERGEIKIIGRMAKAWMGAPLIVNGEAIGVLVIQDYENEYAYDSMSLEIMQLFADNLSLYIERTKYEEQIRLLGTAIEQNPNIIIITDLSGKIIYANPMLEKVTGYAIHEAIGKNPRMFKSDFHSKDFYANLWNTILRGEVWRGEILNKRKNGELYWESVSIAPIKDQEGKIFRFVAIKQDITEQKNLIKELTEAKEKAEEMNRLKTQFFAYMSHELRTPFLGIMGYAQLLKELSQSEEAVEMAEGILRSSQRLVDTLSNILDLTKLEFDKTEAVFKETNVCDAIEEVYKQFEKIAQQKNIELRKNILFPKLIILTDERFLLGILSNLVNNAIKFTSKGYVEVYATYENNKLIIKVIDTGIGIPEEKREVIFEEFRQVSEGTSRDFQGSGLGLTIVKKYTQLLNGKISVESQVNVGTTFTVEFPAEVVEK